DMICVLEASAPDLKIRDHCFLCVNGKVKNWINESDTDDEGEKEIVEQPMNNLCDCLDFTSKPFLVNQHYEHSHGEFDDVLYLPGETCSNINESHLRLRYWFKDRNMHCRELYNKETSGFFKVSPQTVVASPKDDVDSENKPDTDIVFIKKPKDYMKSALGFAWSHIVTSPYLMGQVCFGMENDKRRLLIKNLDM